MIRVHSRRRVLARSLLPAVTVFAVLALCQAPASAAPTSPDHHSAPLHSARPAAAVPHGDTRRRRNGAVPHQPAGRARHPPDLVPAAGVRQVAARPTPSASTSAAVRRERAPTISPPARSPPVRPSPSSPRSTTRARGAVRSPRSTPTSSTSTRPAPRSAPASGTAASPTRPPPATRVARHRPGSGGPRPGPLLRRHPHPPRRHAAAGRLQRGQRPGERHRRLQLPVGRGRSRPDRRPRPRLHRGRPYATARSTPSPTSPARARSAEGHHGPGRPGRRRRRARRAGEGRPGLAGVPRPYGRRQPVPRTAVGGRGLLVVDGAAAELGGRGQQRRGAPHRGRLLQGRLDDARPDRRRPAGGLRRRHPHRTRPDDEGLGRVQRPQPRRRRLLHTARPRTGRPRARRWRTRRPTGGARGPQRAGADRARGQRRAEGLLGGDGGRPGRRRPPPTPCPAATPTASSRA